MGEAPMNGLRTRLWPHQREAVGFALDRYGCMLAHEMGAGKTLTAIALAHAVGANRVLVSCPLSVVPVWRDQLAQHSSWQWHVAALDRGSVAKRAELAREMLGKAGRAIVIVNHEAVWRGPLARIATETRWDLVIADESHRLKSARGVASRFFARLGQRVPRRLALTGTPMPHSPLDIYAQMRFIDPAVYGWSWTLFRSRYALMKQERFRSQPKPLQVIVGYQRLDELEKKLAIVCDRVRLADVVDLPPETDQRRVCRLERDARRLYDTLERFLVAELTKGSITAANALSRLLRLQQLTGGWLRADDAEHAELVSTAKRDLLSDTLEDIATGEPVVVFCRFLADIDTVRAVAERTGRTVGEVSGRRKDLVDGRMPEGLDLLAVQIQAGGLGVDLSRAAVAIYYSVGWSLGDLLQARARLHRPGQTRPVTHITLVAEDTVDEQIIEALAKREDLVESVLSKLSGKDRDHGS